MTRCGKRRASGTLRVGNHRCGLDGLGVFCIWIRTLKPRFRNNNFGAGTPTNETCDGICVVFRVGEQAIDFLIVRQNISDETSSYCNDAQFRCRYYFAVLLTGVFNCATKPFDVTRSAKRPRRRHPIERAIHSIGNNNYFHMSTRFELNLEVLT